MIGEIAALLQAIAWPAITLTLAILFRRQLFGVVLALQKRIESGAEIKAGTVYLGPAPSFLEAPRGEDPITEDHMALLHSSWRYPKKDAEFHCSMYAFHVIVQASTEVLDRIESVTYSLHPTYKQRSRQVVTDRGSKFKLKELAWGESIVRAEVQVRGQKDPIQLRRYIDLSPTGPRI